VATRASSAALGIGYAPCMDLEKRVETLETNLKKTQALAGAALGLAVVAFLFGLLF